MSEDDLLDFYQLPQIKTSWLQLLSLQFGLELIICQSLLSYKKKIVMSGKALFLSRGVPALKASWTGLAGALCDAQKCAAVLPG